MSHSFTSANDASWDDFSQYDDQQSRKQRWGSIIDKIEDNLARSVNDNDSRMVQCQRATASSTTDDYFSVSSAPGTDSYFQPAACFAGSRSTLVRRKLREWIQLQKTNASGEIPDTKRYFERSVRILNSLVLKIIDAKVKAGKTEMMVALHPDLIASENIMVHDTAEDGEVAHFIQTEINGCPSLDNVGTKYGAMKALGIVAYELLMMGGSPPVSFVSPSALSDMGGTAHLPLSITGCGECAEAETNQTNQTGRKVARKSVDENQGRITAAMLNSGVPYPLCRFVVDLLGGECSDGLLFRNDNSFESFSDVLLDLKQMINNPEAFIYLSVRDQLRVAFGSKMHGRESEKKLIMDAASRTTGMASNDALFDALSLLLPQNKVQIVMVAGKPGSGKSRLVTETKTDLENQGWFFLSCKFDRIVHSEPLSVMASAFNDFLERCLGSSTQQQISTNLTAGMLSHDVLILTRHIPCLMKYLDDPPSPLADVDVSKGHMHQLFQQLLHVLSVAGQPIAIFVDDLQWADEASIDLFVALSKASEPDLSSSKSHPNKTSKIMLIGSYRDNEVDGDHPLAKVLDQMKSRDSSVEVTDICIRGFSRETLNQLLSESLCLPPRRTKSLTDIIIQKTDGIAIHVIEFIGRLTVDMTLSYSFVNGWEWDSEVIEGCPISDSVAELFVFKLNKLPSNALRALQILSIFGVQMDQHTINLIQDFDKNESVDVTSGLQIAVESGLVEMNSTTKVFKFAHDIIAEAVFDLIPNEERLLLQHKLANALIRNASATNLIDHVIFIAVDLINRLKNEAIADADERILYAFMNEKACKKALAVPDFNSAVKYSESGLAFLDACSWESHHDLTMSLHQMSVAVTYACTNGNQDLLKERIVSVFRRAKSLDEEFKTRLLWITVLSTSRLEESISDCHALLERLGEPIDVSNYNTSHSCLELIRMKECLSEKKHQFLTMSRMGDPNKLKSMKVMSSLMLFYNNQRSNVLVSVSSRMVLLSTKYGYCEESIFGIASFAATLIRILGDIDEGSSWARMALTLVSKFRHNVNVLLPAVYAVVYGLVLIWKEPIQATLDPLLRGCSLAFDYGDIQFAAANAELYIIRSFQGGKNIDVLIGEIEVLAQRCARHGQLPCIQNILTPFYNILRDLKGLPKKALAPLDLFMDNDKLRDRAIDKNNPLVYETLLMVEIVHAFLAGDMRKTHAVADMLEAVIARKHAVVTNVISEFYAGLHACHFARQTRDNVWKSKVNEICSSIERFCRHSEWNFENKLLLLKAECHYTNGEMSDAAKCYQSSIASASNHKFVHEEALACELAGRFFKEQGDESKSKTMFAQAHKAYIKWGAVKKANTLPHT